jgi:hypothetical protein
MNFSVDQCTPPSDDEVAPASERPLLAQSGHAEMSAYLSALRGEADMAYVTARRI